MTQTNNQDTITIPREMRKQIEIAVEIICDPNKKSGMVPTWPTIERMMKVSAMLGAKMALKKAEPIYDVIRDRRGKYFFHLESPKLIKQFENEFREVFEP